ncbi:MAG: hypothetical protein EOO85_22025 [Pedobacter sp.]|nr:MAG: hypothetical protein EOO85_22025 [Pedobacter sp.]
MLENKHIEIIKTLANGIDPITGEVFAPDSPYQQPDIIRALNYATQRLKPVKPQQERHGKPWSTEEDNKISDAFKSGTSLSKIAQEQQRTRGSIESRLGRLGLIDQHYFSRKN